MNNLVISGKRYKGLSHNQYETLIERYMGLLPPSDLHFNYCKPFYLFLNPKFEKISHILARMHLTTNKKL